MEREKGRGQGGERVGVRMDDEEGWGKISRWMKFKTRGNGSPAECVCM